MKKLCCWVLALTLLLSGCARTSVPDGDAAITDNPSAAPEAEELLETLCAAEYQGRAVGGVGNALAAEYIASFFGTLGLEPLFDDYLQPYEEQCVRTEQAEAHAALIAADGMRTDLTAGTDFIFYPVYESVEVTLPISEDAAACAGGTAFFYAEDAQAARRFSSDAPDSFSVACADLDEYTSLNTNTDADRGAFLLLTKTYRAPLRAEGTKLELSLSPCLEKGTASNVAAVLNGSEGKNAFVVGAHFDGTGVCGERFYPSAYDNASGTVTMLETARLLSGTLLKNDVIFVAFNGEESGYDGARAFANQALDRYDHINLINFDCVGHRDSALYTVFDDYGLNAPLKTALMDFLGDSAGGDDLPSDGRVFSDFANVSCVSVADGDFDGLFALSPLHSPADLPEQIDFARIRELASAAAEIIRAETLYEQDAALMAEQPDDVTGLLPAELEQYHRLIDEGMLNTYTQAYVYSTGEGGSQAFTGKLKRLLSAEELEATCPALGIPESIGEDYRFVYAELQSRLDGTQQYGVRIKLPETLEVGTLIDLTGRITPFRVIVYYLSPDGRGIEVVAGPTIEDSFAGMEDGGALNAALKGVMLMHSVNSEGLDGYWRLGLPQENDRVIYIKFVNGVDLVQPVTVWIEDFWGPKIVYLTPDKLLAEFAALDLTPFKRVCEQIKDS